MKKGIWKNCEKCCKSFYVYPYEMKRRRFCSTNCANLSNALSNSKSKTGNKNPMFGKVPVNFKGKKINYHGYVEIFAPKHPRARCKFVLEHRLVMEKDVGRFLRAEEVVHHKDGNKKNNKINNLILCKNEYEHRTFHKQR